jgi:hypothetical protein
MEKQPSGIDFATAYEVLLRAYVRNHTLYEGLKVEYRCDKQWVKAVVTTVGPGPWDDRMVHLRFEDGTEQEVHCKQIKVPNR